MHPPSSEGCSKPPAPPASPCEVGEGLDPADQEVRMAMRSGDPETVATLVNKQAKVAAKDLSLLLDLLPSENLRWSGDSPPTAKSFQVGSFVIRGVRSSTLKFRETAKAMCAYVKQLFPAFTFGTVGLFRDVCAVPHRDSNNEASTDNAIAALSSFEEGGLWMEDPEGDTAMDFKGKEVMGVRVGGGSGLMGADCTPPCPGPAAATLWLLTRHEGLSF